MKKNIEKVEKHFSNFFALEILNLQFCMKLFLVEKSFNKTFKAGFLFSKITRFQPK